MKLRQVVLHAVLIVAGFMCLAPFVWMFFASFKTYNDVLLMTLLPHTWTLSSYQELLSSVGFLQGFANSLKVAIPGTLSVVLTSTAAGYIFSKYQFPGKEALFTLLLATMMVPFTVLVIPLYLTMGDLGLIDNAWGLLVTSLCGTFGIFLMRQNIEGIPNDYIDAARIDGAGEWWIFLRVISPLVASSIATLAVFTFLGLWDNYLWPSVLLRSPDQQTIPMVIASLRSLYVERYNMWAAGSMLTVLPVMVLFTFIQRYFVKGLSMTGLKG